MRENLLVKIEAAIGMFVLNHAMLFLFLFLLGIAAVDFYNRFFRLNRRTDHIDLMKEYTNLQLRRKYKQ